MINWKVRPINLPEFEEARKQQDKPYRTHDMKLVYMHPRKFIDFQLKMNPYLHQKDTYMKEYDKRLYQGMKGGEDKIPAVILELNKDGSLSGWQEGYRRSRIAWILGEDKIPVWIATKRR